MFFLLIVLLFTGPRGVMFVWWLLEPARWSLAFQGILVPILGFILAPWTTLAYLVVYPHGLDGADWLLLGLAVLADLATYAGGGLSARRRAYPATY